MVGDPVIIGVVLGLIFGLAAGEGFKGCATLMITVAAIMVLFPRRVWLQFRAVVRIAGCDIRKNTVYERTQY
ncbi:hypothetical protein A3219_20455 [Salmonella enterica]|nr:hypothetical protein A3219_20455 [Salmonella enterica]